ncbi:PqqD family protein [Sphingomonas sp. MMS24-J45]|uniref:PqqD family protein n=1 Tax=Sphingomonas sp. MMS24-J45 TaxID=3238806 RepID=UPI00384D456A
MAEEPAPLDDDAPADGLSDATMLVQSSGVIGAEVSGEIVLIGVETGRYHGFDAVGSAIWRALETPIRVDDLCARMVAHFAGDAATITLETRAFVAQLLSRNLATTVA